MSDSDDDAPPDAVDLLAKEAVDLLAPPPPAIPPRESGPPVPVTMITGFLGAGKTTLVQYILTAKHGYRIAVLINEFGASRGIESAMVQDAEGGENAVSAEEWVEVANGCLCCSVKDDFVQALENLMERRSKFDYILLETTGLADPGPVAGVLWVDDELEARVCLDSIVTVVDGVHLKQQLAEEKEDGAVNEAALQIAYADTILLNKTDLLPEGATTSLEDELRTINSHASILRTERCQVDLGAILNRGTFGPDRVHRVAAGLESGAGGAGSSGGGGGDEEHPHGEHGGGEGHVCGDNCGHDHGEGAAAGHVHDSRVGTISFPVETDVDISKLYGWLDGLLWEHAEVADVYRMKALLPIKGSDKNELYEVMPGAPWASGEARVGRVVAIGRHLKEGDFRRSFEAAQGEGGLSVPRHWHK